MKAFYNTPEINVEELTKTDVLCASNEVIKNDVYNAEGSAQGWTVEDFL